MGVANISGNILTDSGASLSSYLPLTGGTLTGALTVGTNLTVGNTLNGNVGQFSNSMTASAYFVNGMTAGSGALYWTSNKVTLANYNSGGSLTFDVNGGTTALTLASTGAATFSRNDAANVSVTIANAYLNQGNLINFQQNKSGSTINAYIGHGGDSTGNFIINNGTQSVTIANNGAVGMNSTSPNTSTVLTLQESGTLSGALSMLNRNSTQRWSLAVDATAVDDKVFSIIDNTGSQVRFAITPSGNVGIGTSSPMTFGGFTNLTIASSTTTNQAALFLVNSNATIRGSFYTNGNSNVRLGTATSHDLLFDTADTERMRITSGGSVGIGTTSPVAKLDISIPSTFTTAGAFASSGINLLDPTNVGAYSQITFGYTPGRSYAAGYMGYVSTSSVSGGFGDLVFGTRPTYDIQPSERMRITSGGYVLVGYTSSPSAAGLLQTTSAYVGSLGTGIVYSLSGVLTSTNPSDLRLKENVEDLGYGLKEILQLRPVKYNWKNDNANQGKQFGFIAQEVQEVMPELVTTFETEDGERLGLEKEGIYAALVQSIQELKAEIDELKNK